MKKKETHEWISFLVFLVFFILATVWMIPQRKEEHGKKEEEPPVERDADQKENEIVVVIREIEDEEEREEPPEHSLMIEAEADQEDNDDQVAEPAIDMPLPAVSDAQLPSNETVDESGSAPFISACYRRYLGFPGYVREMRRLGGVFLLYDPVNEKIKAEIDMDSGSFSRVNIPKLKRMSPRMREINKEIAISGLLAKAKSEFGAGQYTVIMLLPRTVDSRILRNVCRKLTAHDLIPENVTRLVGEYVKFGNSLNLRISEAITDDGQTLDVDFALEF